MSQLALLMDGVVAKLFLFEKPTIIIGRTPDRDILIENNAVSSSHAQIEVSSSQLLKRHEAIFLEDMCIRNGTLVNDQKIKRCQLH